MSDAQGLVKEALAGTDQKSLANVEALPLGGQQTHLAGPEPVEEIAPGFDRGPQIIGSHKAAIGQQQIACP